MELEEALQKIKDLETQVTEIEGKHKDELTTLKATHDKEAQISYNKGFDKAKNASKDEMEKGFISKDEVQKMMKDQSDESNIKLELSKAGVKNVDKAFKLIDDKESFNIESFKEDNKDILVFKEDDNKDDKNNKDDKDHQQMKNNKDDKVEMTAESYANMSNEERSKVSIADKLALV